MNLHSRKGIVEASSFYALMFVGLTEILGMVLPPDLALMTAQAQTTQDRKEEADQLLEKGNQLSRSSKYKEALQTWDQALQIYRYIKDNENEGNTLYNLAEASRKLGQYQKALEIYRQVLAIFQRSQNLNMQGNTLIGIGEVFRKIGQYKNSIDSFQQALIINQKINDLSGEGKALVGLGHTYFFLDQYTKAIKFHQQALTIAKQINDLYVEAIANNSLGLVYVFLSQPQKAIPLHERSLTIFKQINDRNGEADTFKCLGIAYDGMGMYKEAIDFYQQALTIARQIDDLYVEGVSLNALGSIYFRFGSLSEQKKGLEFIQQALAVKKQIGDRTGEASVLSNLGEAYQSLGEYQKAFNFYQQSVEINKQIGDRANAGTSLSQLGLLFNIQKQPELAIIFYKQSVNVRESIRKDIRELSQDVQKSYLTSVESTYRNLADLLLKQDRILEAQQVLDLLKVEELSEYLKTVRGNSQTAKGIEYQPPEQNFIALAIELDELQKRKLANSITAAEQERLNKLVKSEQEQQNQFIAFLDSDPVQILVEELRLKEKLQNVDITNNFQNLRTDILSKHPNAVLLYPLILEDRLELILITAKTTPIRRTINVKREKLNAEIVEFLAGLRDSGSEDVKQPAKQLHTWLIKPFEAELAELKIDTIIYAPDGQLRYIPLAALYDGKQWLVEKYRVNNITAASLTKFNKPPISTPKIFAGAFGNVNKQGLSALPATLIEVKKIADRFPSTTTLVETAFTKELTTSNSNSYTILHLATHGQLSTGDPKNSFILFGDGEKATISDIRKWVLTNVDLVVLSACQSGIGAKLGSGVEILGLGYQMQAAGARVAIASLWKVDDAGTQALMESFYGELKKGDVSIVEALRRAQIAMINSDKQGIGSDRAGVRIVGTVPNASQLSHPYYWSAFFAIGNGL
ncbi:hypothetical protein APA_2407 [Pseudanabaena sp. lw0831]|uniref:CHAT domain-containing protein n=1 Tax=Pseudanabaena sp. lw0831 TaxID=1357935 RepID=UPI001915DA3D|nr:tetratricopeptide repeat protein [Pseudanabaena sp. lw0831]GBO54459.1 hypothetical protein APA_2407 [Pseudanabaena sp. lw0831]